MKRSQQLGIFDFTMIVIGLVIGMGIFGTVSRAAKSVDTPIFFFSAWIAGGLIALCGALTFAEIGSRYPVTGGFYRVFSYTYHPSVAFSINCIALITNAGAIAGVALIGAGYISQVIFDQSPSDGVKLTIAISAVILFYGINLLGLKMSSRAQNILMLIKLGMILLLIIPLFIPTLYHQTISTPNGGVTSGLPTVGEKNWIGHFGLALVAVSFAYTGYQQTINFGPEVSNPSRNLPRSIILGIIVVVVLYSLVNLAYFKVLGFEGLRQQNEVARVVASRLLGETGGNIFSGLLFLSVLAYVNVMLLSNPRAMVAMSEDRVLPPVFARKTTKRQVLVVSLTAFAAICVIILLFARTFEQILSFTIFLDSLGMASAAAAIFKLRRTNRHSDVPGIYKMRLYPLLPVIFIASYCFVATSIAVQTPRFAVIGAATLLSFIAIYWITRLLRKTSTPISICITAALIFTSFSCHRRSGGKYDGWQVYGGSKENIHYSSLAEIDTGNVGRLQVAWVYHTHDADSFSQIQVNPLIVHGVLYGVSPRLKVFALDAATGQPKWVFDPMQESPRESSLREVNACRGLTWYDGGNGDQRLFYTAGSWLYAIDATSGKPVAGFGKGGRIDLHQDLGRDTRRLSVTSTTPGIIYKNLLIVGTRVAEDATAAPGHIRAYEVHTGKLRWIFHTIPYPGEKGYETWDDKDAYKNIGGANSWAGFSLDEEKGIVFAPVGSASFDFYGGKRTGDDLFANCVLALDAATGKRIWHFQTVHHDIWDRDLPTAPALVTMHKDGQTIEAVAQVTKSGFIFLLDRQTGKPVYPVKEQAVPTATELQGEKPAPTQPFPTVLKPFARQAIGEADLNRLVPDSSYQDIRRRLEGYRTGFIFNPPSKEGTVIFPGFDGGAEWGGPAYDPETGLLYINASEMPWILTMVDATSDQSISGGGTIPPPTRLHAARVLYSTNCQSCHGANREGGGNSPSLMGLGKKYDNNTLTALISSGRRMMPAFPQLTPPEKEALADMLLEHNQGLKEEFKDTGGKSGNPYYNLPYRTTGYNKFLTKEGYPAISPPWGSLTAIDLNTAQVVWKDTLGDYPEFKAKGIHTGTENYGGPVVTAGGVLFIAATRDSRFRAFDKRTGRLIWEAELPACGFATPAVYETGGRQYVVIACGGGKLHQRSGDAYVAFALP